LIEEKKRLPITLSSGNTHEVAESKNWLLQEIEKSLTEANNPEYTSWFALEDLYVQTCFVCKIFMRHIVMMKKSHHWCDNCPELII